MFALDNIIRKAVQTAIVILVPGKTNVFLLLIYTKGRRHLIVLVVPTMCELVLVCVLCSNDSNVLMFLS